MKVAKFLAKHPKVGTVHYPGCVRTLTISSRSAKCMDSVGMLAFDMKGGLAAARRFCDRVEVFLLAASLGGVESLVVLPIFSSHAKMSSDELRAAGVSQGTIRMSVGIENPEDLIEDLGKRWPDQRRADPYATLAISCPKVL